MPLETVDIDLEQSPKEETETLEVSPGEKESDEAVESNFPHFHFESPTPLDIPKSGKMLVEYEIVFEGPENEESETEAYVYKIDLHRIVGLEGEEPETAGAALDKLAAARQREKAAAVPAEEM